MKKTNFIDAMSAQEQIHARRVGYGYGAFSFLLFVVVGAMQIKQCMQWYKAKKEFVLRQHQAEGMAHALQAENELQQKHQDMQSRIMHINSLKKSAYNPAHFIASLVKVVAIENIKKIVLHCNECELTIRSPDINYALQVVHLLSAESEFKHMHINSMQQGDGGAMVVVMSNVKV